MRKALAALCALTLLRGTVAADVTAVGLDKTQYTSDFAIGSVAVSVIFVESTGAIDAKSERWTDDRKTLALSKILNGLDWWTRQNPRSPLSFTVVSQTVNTDYEPITRPYWDESLWIPDVMGRLGYSGTRFTAVRNYDNALRTAQKTDWGVTLFVVDSLNDTNGKFADGMFAYSYLGGPYTVMTYDNNGYGVSNMDVVYAHELGHIFNALDEYAGASSASEYSYGYFRIINGNHESSTQANDPDSIMRGGIHWGLDQWARKMVGWVDSDNNGHDDIVNCTPLSSFASVASAGGLPTFSGTANVTVIPRQGNGSGNGLTVDTIQKVEYRLGTGEWASATPADGRFDSGAEAFSFNFAQGDASAQSIGAQDVNIRVTTYFASAGGGNPSLLSASLSNAHAFPNPFKPNSGLGHDKIHFTGLTPGAKVQIFTPSGEAVYEKEIDGSSSTLDWSAVNDAGQQLSSGVYLYLITSSDGDHKKGKIAIVR